MAVGCLIASLPFLRPRGTSSETAPASPSFNTSHPTRHLPGNYTAARSSSTRHVEAALSSGNASDKEYVMRHSLPELMSRDITASARMAEKLQPWAWREEVLFQVAQEWARQDPTVAVAWAQQLTDATERTNVFGQVCIEIAKKDPVQALDLAGSHRALQEQLLQILATRDAGAAIRWAEKLTDSHSRQSAFARIALGHAETSPQEAAHLVAEHLATGPLQDETALAVLHKWILRDPAGARAWVGIFPEGPLLEIAESELAAAAAYPVSQ